MKATYKIMATIFIPFLLVSACLFSAVLNDNQAVMPIPGKLEWEAVYSYDGKNWYEYSEESELPVFEGPLRVKGHVTTEIEKGSMLTYYCNHIGSDIYLNGELIYMDAQKEMMERGMELTPSMCGKRWAWVSCPRILPEDELEICFVNHHDYGNRHAYEEALSTFMLGVPESKVVECYLKPYTKPFKMLASAVLIIAFLLLGAAGSAAVLKNNVAERLLLEGMVTLFAGGYILFDVMEIHIWDELLVIKTYGRQLCMMFAIYFFGMMLCESFTGKRRKIAGIIVACSGVVNVILILMALAGQVLIFDTGKVWVYTQYVSCPILLVLCLLEIAKSRRACRLEHFSAVVLMTTILLDLFDVFYNMFYPRLWTKSAFSVIMLVHLARAARNMILEHHATIRNAKLQQELEDSRIKIMMSQIQPHFLYNSLTCVMDLCDTNPKQAKAAIADFADYLRANISSLKSEKLIPFRKELEHMEKYLRLEKLRFQDELNVCYEIETDEFLLPSLTVQPLVENAVKHGLGKKTGGGTVTIRTAEVENDYEITIADDGVGFVEGEDVSADGNHVGLDNIRRRLEMMTNATLEIKSVKGEGTTACIRIPKRGNQ